MNSKVASLRDESTVLGKLMHGMRAAYANGKNAMEFARKSSEGAINSEVATLIAYDLQAGTYSDMARSFPQDRAIWCKQIAEILDSYIETDTSVLEVGSGEATTLAGVVKLFSKQPKFKLGLDISWSRCAHGLSWLEENGVNANLFVGDLFEIPLEDSSVDIVYTSHSLEPNGGKEEAALKELLRVAKRAVILIEPLYELANSDAKKRMDKHGYIRNLKRTAEIMGENVKDYRLLDFSFNPLNPSGLILIEKTMITEVPEAHIRWRCPLTNSPLIETKAGFYSVGTGVVYPVLGGIPLLRSTHAVIASSFETFCDANPGISR